MNIKRTVFWTVFLLVIVLIIWGLAVAMQKNPSGLRLGEPRPIDSTDYSIGPMDAPVTLIEYSDFQCPACENYYPLVKRLVDESSTTLRFSYRHFPLDNLLPDGTVQHPNANIAAMAAEAAGAQGKFWEMYDTLFSDHENWTELKDPKPVFMTYAAKIGLNTNRFAEDLSSTTLSAKIRAEKDEGIKVGINSTPTFFVNGKAIANPQSYEQFKAIIDEAAKSGAK